MEEFKRILQWVGAELGLRNAAVYDSPLNSGLALRWINDDEKYEQVIVFGETFISRGEQVTAEAVKSEVARRIDAGETEVLN